MIIGLILGIIIMAYDIYNKKKISPDPANINSSDLNLAEQAVIYNNSNKNKAGVAAQIFHLAKQEKIKLISQVKKDFSVQKKIQKSLLKYWKK